MLLKSFRLQKSLMLSTANFEDLTSQYFGFKQNLNDSEILKKLNNSVNMIGKDNLMN